MDKDKTKSRDIVGADPPITAPADSNAGAEAGCDEVGGAQAWTAIDNAIPSDEDESGGEDDDENYDMGPDSGLGGARDFARTKTSNDEAAHPRTRLHNVEQNSEGVMTVQMPELAFEARDTWVGPNNLIQIDDPITDVARAVQLIGAVDQASYHDPAAFDGQESPYLTSAWGYLCIDHTATQGEGMPYTSHGMSMLLLFPQPLSQRNF